MRSSKVIIVAIAIVVAAIYVFTKPLFTNTEQQDADSTKVYTLPWNIEINDDGTSNVFGITLEHTTVDELLQLHGIDHELAIISDDYSGLEIYYSHFPIGPLQGKLIARVRASQQQLDKMQAAAASSSYTGSGSRKFLLSEDDLTQIQNWPIDSISYLPSARLDESIILDRFGEPEERINGEDNIEHFLYPTRGLDIVLNTEGKELLQYVAPRSFSALAEPLKTLTSEDSVK
ncbi:MAG: hypothetical protein CL693_13935 [Cellvibrionaceae bacterium]|nr:hypothetical protein [Cellvibrionaceae bacterium]|tara:strand:- start:8015 stop:8710 length:696 start_codon:yes stop_codon:yes gene_type:complete